MKYCQTIWIFTFSVFSYTGLLAQKPNSKGIFTEMNATDGTLPSEVIVIWNINSKNKLSRKIGYYIVKRRSQKKRNGVNEGVEKPVSDKIMKNAPLTCSDINNFENYVCDYWVEAYEANGTFIDKSPIDSGYPKTSAATREMTSATTQKDLSNLSIELSTAPENPNIHTGFSAIFSIRNDDNKPLTEGVARFYLSKEENISENETPLYEMILDTIAANSTKRNSVTLHPNKSLSAGTYNLIMVVSEKKIANTVKKVVTKIDLRQ